MSGQTSPTSGRKNTGDLPKGGVANLRKGGGRPKGVPNKTTTAIKDMILKALDEADPEGAVAYLKKQASSNPTAFLTLVGKVIPLQVAGSGDNGEHVHRIELVGVVAK